MRGKMLNLPIIASTNENRIVLEDQKKCEKKITDGELVYPEVLETPKITLKPHIKGTESHLLKGVKKFRRKDKTKRTNQRTMTKVSYNKTMHWTSS